MAVGEFQWAKDVNFERLVGIGFAEDDLKAPFFLQHIATVLHDVGEFRYQNNPTIMTELYLKISNDVFNEENDSNGPFKRDMTMHYAVNSVVNGNVGEICADDIENYFDDKLLKIAKKKKLDLMDCFDSHYFAVKKTRISFKQSVFCDYYVAEYLFVTFLQNFCSEFTVSEGDISDFNIGKLDKKIMLHFGNLMLMLLNASKSCSQSEHIVCFLKSQFRSIHYKKVFVFDDDNYCSGVKKDIFRSALDKCTKALLRDDSEDFFSDRSRHCCNKHFISFRHKLSKRSDYFIGGYEKFVLLFICTKMYDFIYNDSGDDKNCFLSVIDKNVQHSLFSRLFALCREIPPWAKYLFRGIDAQGCDFSGFCFDGIDFSYGNFSYTILRNAKLGHADMCEVNFMNAKLEGAVISSSVMRGCLFDQAEMKFMTILECSFYDVAFCASDLSQCYIYNSLFKHCNFCGLIAKDALFSRVSLADLVCCFEGLADEEQRSIDTISFENCLFIDSDVPSYFKNYVSANYGKFIELRLEYNGTLP